MLELASIYGMGDNLPEILGEGIDMVKGLDQVMSQVAATRALAVNNLRLFNQGVCNEIHRRDEAAAQAAGRRISNRSERREYAIRSLIAELSAALSIPAGSAARLIHVSEKLVHELPGTLAALSAGRISYQHANVLVDHVVGLDSDACADLEQAVLPLAEGLTPTQLDRKTRRIREKLHPDSIAERHAKSRADRRVYISAEHDGMATLTANLPAPEAFGIYNKLTMQARNLQTADEKRTLSQLRADVLMDAVLVSGGAGELPTGTYVASEALAPPLTSTGCFLAEPPMGDISADECEPVEIPGLRLSAAGSGASPVEGSGAITMKRSGKGRGARFKSMRPLVVVTVPAMTLLGHSDEPGDLQGYGPIDPDTAREIAAHAPSFIRLLTHPETGVVLSMGKKRYKPPKALRAWLQIRDETCRYPGCNRGALHCEVDHTLEWAKAGTTDHTNLSHLCKTDHGLKHKFGWTASQDRDGTLSWISPTGHQYSTRPETPIHVPLPATRGSAGATSPPVAAQETTAPLESAPLESALAEDAPF